MEYGAGSVTIDVAPYGYVKNYWDEYSTKVLSVHGEVLACNTDQPSCYAPNVGDEGHFVPGPSIYTDFPNVTIEWDNGNVATYALHQEY